MSQLYYYPQMDYTTLSLVEVRAALEEISQETEPTFGDLDVFQLNWRPDVTQWSVAQCFEHLLTANRLMFRAAKEAIDDNGPRTLWRRVPVFPRVLGRMLIRSQAPDSERKYTASSKAQPATSGIGADIIQRFIAQERDAVAWMGALDEPGSVRTIMTSPFIRVVTYSVLDGCRLVVAHDHRHFEQARRVTLLPGFPTRDRSPDKPMQCTGSTVGAG